MSQVTKWMVDQLVSPEAQVEVAKTYRGVNLDAVRLAWPFKTEQELKILAAWHRKHLKELKQKQIEDHVKTYGAAFL